MPLSNNLTTYDAIAANTKIQFKSGTQAALNLLIKNGGATEGTFYLTTDTHKLYVGRKKTSGGTVYPEQVSRGVTVVGTSSELPNPNGSSASASGSPDAIEEGELFYITDSNVLAALRKVAGSNPVTYEWVQINPPTGITSIATAAVTNASDAGVDIRTTVSTAAGDKIGAFKVTAGDNVTITPSSGTVSDGTNSIANQGKITIAATDTTYKAAVETNTSKGVLGLISKTSGSFGTTLDASKIDIEGANSVKVTSNATNGKITVTGPNLTGVSVENHTTDGFTVSLSGTNGDGSAIGSSTTFTPHIAYGATTGYSEPATAVSFNQNTTAAFANGTATLNVYTKPQADQAITDAINAKLATANAMTYMGTVTSGNATNDTTSLFAKVSANGAHNGDTYKVSGLGTNETFQIGGKNVQIGDLIIIHGTETNGEIAIPNNNFSGLLTLCELVPSGDEPEFNAELIVSAAASSPSGFHITDAKVTGSNLLTANFNSGNKINVTSAQGADNKTIDITLDHSTTTRTDNTTKTLTTATDADSIGTSKIKMFVLDGKTSSSKVVGVKTDSYGHVTGIEGKIITFQHNYVDGINVEYNTSNGQISLTPNNAITGFNSTTPSKITLASSTLQIKGNTSTSAVDIDLVWGTF